MGDAGAPRLLAHPCLGIFWVAMLMSWLILPHIAVAEHNECHPSFGLGTVELL